jgi:hypothetical protein
MLSKSIRGKLAQKDNVFRAFPFKFLPLKHLKVAPKTVHFPSFFGPSSPISPLLNQNPPILPFPPPRLPESHKRVYVGSQGVFPLSRLALKLRFVACFVLFSASAGLAQQPATTPAGPVPPAILDAKKIFLSNSGISSTVYSGGQNRAYNQFYEALQGSRFFEMAGDPSDADLVLELQLANSAPGPDTFKLLIYDRKTRFLLWTLLEPITVCTRQKTCDTNFDDALLVLLLNYEKLAGKAPGAAR